MLYVNKKNYCDSGKRISLNHRERCGLRRGCAPDPGNKKIYGYSRKRIFLNHGERCGLRRGCDRAFTMNACRQDTGCVNRADLIPVIEDLSI